MEIKKGFYIITWNLYKLPIGPYETIRQARRGANTNYAAGTQYEIYNYDGNNDLSPIGCMHTVTKMRLSNKDVYLLKSKQRPRHPLL